MLPPVTKLRPCSLIVLRTQISGGVHYARTDLTPETIEPSGAAVASWETTRTIQDAAEYAEAVKVRSDIRNRVVGACRYSSAFGLMLPADDEKPLDDALTYGRQRAEEFNARSRTCKVNVTCLRGKVATSDEEAVAAISAEIGALMARMERAIRRADPAEIRKAAEEAKAVSAALADDARARVSAAVDEARKAAREITRRVGKAGEDAAAVVAEIALPTFTLAAAALDLDPVTFAPPTAPDAAPVDLPPVTAAPLPTGPAMLALDFDAEPEPVKETSDAL